jgi:hypothetical protein
MLGTFANNACFHAHASGDCPRHDPRCNSIQDALRFAKEHFFLGMCLCFPCGSCTFLLHAVLKKTMVLFCMLLVSILGGSSAGITVPSWIVLEAPVLCETIKESGLLLFTYGQENESRTKLDDLLSHKVGAYYVEQRLLLWDTDGELLRSLVAGKHNTSTTSGGRPEQQRHYVRRR